MRVTGEFCDAPGLSILDFHTQEFASRVGRNVKVAVAAEGDPVESDTPLRRRENRVPCEYFERRGAFGSFRIVGFALSVTYTDPLASTVMSLLNA